MNIGRELTDLKEKINNAQTEQSKLEGKKEQIMSQLKEKFKVTTTKKAEKLLSKMKTELTNMSGRLNSGLDRFKEDYGDSLDEY